ncbi:MAG: AraC family transcriptional regulator ligand-binding domain-containing protein [Selenomonadaceae bacterium]|nr:AraC family transcriptional regulator ligand-binding domain-containing protein [Selenomonadaceae bacterium]
MEQMKSPRRYPLDGNYKPLLESCGIHVEEALRKAGQPEDAFKHSAPSMTAEAYFAFMEAVGTQISRPEQIIRIGSAETISSFSPSVFAAYCSRDGKKCLERLSQYKRLVGPVKFDFHESHTELSLEIASEDGNFSIPPFLAAVETVFLVHLLLSATKEKIIPLQAEFLSIESELQEELSGYFGCHAQIGEKNRLVFSATDMRLPFVTWNESMWNFFEPELRRRLSELAVDASISARLRSALIELLPGGDSSMEGATHKLGISRRTLQRRLTEEVTTFQEQLNHTRELLAKHYLKDKSLTGDEIAYLLGYQEQNSFLRAFLAWTGMSISEYKKSLKA